MAVFVGLLAVVLFFIFNLIFTSVVIWAVNEIWSFDMPFWPVFWLIFVFYNLLPHNYGKKE